MYAEQPTCGITLSLEQAGSVTLGANEFVCEPVPVNDIEVLAVYVNAAKLAGHNPVEQRDAWQLMVDHLKAL